MLVRSSCVSLFTPVRCHSVHLRGAAASLLRRLRWQSTQGQPKPQAATCSGQHAGAAWSCWWLQRSCAPAGRHWVQVRTVSASLCPLCRRSDDDKCGGKLMIVLAPSPAVRQLGPSLYSCSHTERRRRRAKERNSLEISFRVHKNIFMLERLYTPSCRPGSVHE